MHTGTPVFEFLVAMIFSTLPACDQASPDTADVEPPTSTDAMGAPDERDPPGLDCSCDMECRPLPDHPAICVFGVCMLRPRFRQTCEGPARTCPAAMQLREVYEYGGFVCYPECAAFECDGDCDRFGACIDTEDTDFWCDPLCSSYCSDDSFR